MIESISIRDLGVISNAEVGLEAGLVVVTGETGAGKTMLLGALDLLLGGRADTGLIRNGALRASVDARISGPLPAQVREFVDPDEGDGTDGEDLLLGRSVTGQRSRAWLNGRPVPASILRQVGGYLVARHGQSDQLSLASGARRRDLLDAFGGPPLAAALADYRSSLAELRSAQDRQRELAESLDIAGWQVAALREGVEEIDRLDPQPGEDSDLQVEQQRLAHAVDLRQQLEWVASSLHEDSDGQPAIANRLSELQQALQGASRLDPTLEPLAAQVQEAALLVTDAAVEISSHASGLTVDPQRLEFVHQRLAALSSIRRKYGESLSEVLRWADEARARLADLDAGQSARAQAQTEVDRAKQECARAALALTGERRRAASALAKQVEGELGNLAMSGTSFDIALTTRPDESGLPLADGPVAYGDSGTDLVEFLIRTAHGPARPLGQSASGGELSRIMLAIEVALAACDPVPVMVFDEIDAGVGGRAAVEVGRVLARLARTAQVIVVTHLAQVAAFADQHIAVTRDADGTVTQSTVRSVTGADRLRELARMLSGMDDSAAAAVHAEELLELAAVHNGDSSEVDLRSTRSARARVEAAD